MKTKKHKFSVYLEDIFIRNIIIKDYAWGKAEPKARLKLKELYPAKHSLLQIKREYRHPYFEARSISMAKVISLTEAYKLLNVK